MSTDEYQKAKSDAIDSLINFLKIGSALGKSEQALLGEFLGEFQTRAAAA